MRSSPIGTGRRRAATALLCGLVLVLALPAAALGGPFAPEAGGGSPNAEKIRDLYIVVAILGAIVFFGVEGLLIYALIKFRHRRGGPPAAQIRGNTPLEIGWTLGAAALLVILTVVTFIFLPGIKNPAPSKEGGYVASASQAPEDSPSEDRRGGLSFAAIDQKEPPGAANEHLKIAVDGRQYLWRFDYPGEDGVFAYHDLVVPINTTVVLDITASDVDHSWWIPKLGGKADAVPGHTNSTWFRISEPGSYWGQCAEFCGENHADMTARVIAVTPEEFEQFLEQQAADLKQSQALLGLQRKTRETSTATSEGN